MSTKGRSLCSGVIDDITISVCFFLTDYIVVSRCNGARESPSTFGHGGLLSGNYQTSNISRILVGNKCADHSDVVEASPVGAAPTTSLFLT